MMLHADNSASYLNFGLTSGADGYGLRNNNGKIEFKDVNPFVDWTPLGGGGGTTHWSKDDTALYYLGGNVGIGYDPGPSSSLNPSIAPRLLDICGSLINGYDCSALPTKYAHAEGFETTASGFYSHAEDYACIAGPGFMSHAEGSQCHAYGNYSHAEGFDCSAYGQWSHAEGYDCSASGNAAHAEGYKSSAIGDYSHAEGSGYI